MAKKIDNTRMVTGEIRASFANVFTPKSFQGGPLKYSMTLLIPKHDTATVNMIHECVEAAKQEGIKTLGGSIPPVLKLPLRDGDAEKPGDEVYAGHYFINASANENNKPGVVANVGGKATPIDESQFYSGCYCMVSINFYAFNKINKGIACGLNNIMKTRDGDKLSGGGRSAAEDFGLDEDGNEFM
jgi:hypothetical protein